MSMEKTRSAIVPTDRSHLIDSAINVISILMNKTVGVSSGDFDSTVDRTEAESRALDASFDFLVEQFRVGPSQDKSHVVEVSTCSDDCCGSGQHSCDYDDDDDDQGEYVEIG